MKDEFDLLRTSNSKISDVNTTFIDPTALDFKLMRNAYEADNQEDASEAIDVPYKDTVYLELANIWVEAYSQTIGLPDAGKNAFSSFINEQDFDTAMEIAQSMRGERIEAFRDVLTATFGYGNPTATEIFIRFVANPKIASMFEIYSYHTTADHEAEYEKDKLLDSGHEKLNAILKDYENKINGINVESLHEDEQEEKPQEGGSATAIPTIMLEDFSPKSMFEYSGLVDFDGQNLIIIGPNGERVIDENPDEKLVKTATLNRIWKVTLYNMEPDPTDERLDEIDATLFSGDNAIILDKLSKIFQQGKEKSVHAILLSLSKETEVQDPTTFIHKVFDFLSNLAQFGEMDLDFNGVRPRSEYIQMVQENEAPVLERKPNKF